MALAPTPRDMLFTEGTAALYRFRGDPASDRLPVLLVPSLINRWYVLDLRPGASLAGSLVSAGFDVYCVDWGVPESEDRYLDWDTVVSRVARMVRRVRRVTGAPRVGLLGYCIGGTLAAIHTALEPSTVAGLVNLAGPIDFAEGGMLAHLVSPRWFDPQAIADAGNVSPHQMQSGFVALRPTLQIAKWVSFLDRLAEPERLEAFMALEEWASANIPFPGAAYARYIRELYQENALARGLHHVNGRRVALSDIRCPVLTVVTDRDVICPPAAAQALNDLSSSADRSLLVIPGGHVGAVVGGAAQTELYPKLAQWFMKTLRN